MNTVTVKTDDEKPAGRGSRRETQLAAKTLCILHDIEADIDTRVSREECYRNFIRMLDIEERHGIDTTYNVLGLLYQDRIGDISGSGHHAVGFHSYNHDNDDLRQLERVREVSRTVKGYRPPNSKITAELTDNALSSHGFEWLASGSSSLGSKQCRIENGIAKIPIDLDDWPLQSGQMDYDQWWDELLDKAAQQEFFAFSLHDCYAVHWLDRYDGLIESLEELGVAFKTCDAVNCELSLSGHNKIRGEESETTADARGNPAVASVNSAQASRMPRR